MIRVFVLLLVVHCSFQGQCQLTDDSLKANEPKAARDYHFIIDDKFTSFSAAEDLITLHHVIHSFKDKYFRPSLFKEDSWYGKTAGVLYRAGKGYLLDFPIDHTLYLLQHEVFGHGAKYRLLDYGSNAYHISAPPPYGSLYGFAQLGKPKKNTYRDMSNEERMGIYSSGVEGTTILAQTMKTKWLLGEGQLINASESFLYLRNAHGITRYLWRTSEQENYILAKVNDMRYYLFWLNAESGYYSQINGLKMTVTDMKKFLTFYGLDAFQYVAAFGYLKYLWGGEEVTKIPMLRIGPVKYLPSFHLGLTPFGAQFNFENYLVIKDKVLSLQYGHGERTFHTFWNQKVEFNNLINNKRFSFSPSVHVWEQPPLDIGGDSIVQTQGGMGGAVYGTFIVKTTGKAFPVNLYVQLAYKTDGYLQGERLDDGLILRGGLSFTPF